MKKLITILLILASFAAFSQRANKGVILVNATPDSSIYATKYDIDTTYLIKPKTVSIVGDITKTFKLALNTGDTIQGSFTDLVGDPGEGDNWGTQVVNRNGTLIGNGVTPLGVDTGFIATQFDLYNIDDFESDPVFAADSAKIVHWADTLTKVATQYDLTLLNESKWNDTTYSALPQIYYRYGAIIGAKNNSTDAMFKVYNSNYNYGLHVDHSYGFGTAIVSNVASSGSADIFRGNLNGTTIFALLRNGTMQFKEGTIPTTPGSGYGYVYEYTDGKLYFKNDAGTAYDLTASFTSPLTTKGDLMTYSTTTTRLPIGPNGYMLSANSAQTTGLEWIAAPAGSKWTDPGSYIYPTNLEHIYLTSDKGISWRNTTTNPGAANNLWQIIPGVGKLNFNYGATPTTIAELITDGTLIIDGTLSVGGNYYLPLTDGLNGQIQKTNGAGTLSWYSTTDWDNAYTHSTTTTGSVHGSTTVGGNFFRLANPSSVTFPRINADNTISTLSAAGLLSAIGGVPTSRTLTINGTTYDLSADRSWTISAGLTNPMTTLGDIIYGGASGTPTRLAGSTGFLKSTGAAAPTWSTIAGSDITGAALTKTDDTNVTLTLGGTPATSLLRATSLTLGWTGQLAVSRGGTGASTLTGVLVGNGTSAITAVTGTASQLLRRNSGNTAYEFFTPTYMNGSGTVTSGVFPIYNGTGGRDLAQSYLTANLTHGGITNTISTTGVYSASFVNTNNIGGAGLFVRGGVGSVSNIAQFSDYNNTPRFSIRGDGAVFAPHMTAAVSQFDVFYNDATGELTVQADPIEYSSAQGILSSNFQLDAMVNTNVIFTGVSASVTFTINTAYGKSLSYSKGTIVISHSNTTAYTLTFKYNTDGSGDDFTALTPNGSGQVALTTSGNGYRDVLQWECLNGIVVVTQSVVH